MCVDGDEKCFERAMWHVTHGSLWVATDENPKFKNSRLRRGVGTRPYRALADLIRREQPQCRTNVSKDEASKPVVKEGKDPKSKEYIVEVKLA